MNQYSEEYRGRTIRVLRDDAHPVVRVDGGNAYLTVAQARRSIDHFADRSCVAHGRCSGDALSELRDHGVYAGVVHAESFVADSRVTTSEGA